MTQCELCGKEENLARAKIEGTLLNVCTKCAVFGELISTPKPIARPVHSERKKDIFIITPDYAPLIRKAREQAGLKQDELASRLHEKASLLQKMEVGDIAPSMALAKKLEDFFRIKLIIPYTEESRETKKGANTELTIGDILLKK